MADRTAFFSMVADVGHDPAITSVLQEGAEIYRSDVERLVEKAKAEGQVREDLDTRLLALGVVGVVAQYANHHRAGRLRCDVDELAEFVGTWVVNALSGG